MKSLLFLLFSLSACTTTPSVDTSIAPEKTPREQSTPDVIDTSATTPPLIDFIGLEEALKLSRPIEELGYKDKDFDTCQAGNGYSHTEPCSKLTFASIHFQLLCRESEGTVSTEINTKELQPITSQEVDWVIGDQKDRVETDAHGYGQIRAAFKKTPAETRLKINVGTKFLYLTAGEITRVVAPQSWCQR